MCMVGSAQAGRITSHATLKLWQHAAWIQPNTACTASHCPHTVLCNTAVAYAADSSPHLHQYRLEQRVYQQHAASALQQRLHQQRTQPHIVARLVLLQLLYDVLLV
jgi:hypothetical protein